MSEEDTRRENRQRFLDLAQQFKRINVTHNVGVIGLVEETVEVLVEGVHLSSGLLIFGAPGRSSSGQLGSHSIRWIDILDMVGVEARVKRRPRWLALNIAKARWGRVEVYGT
jgi:hypothetical protein